MKNNYQERVRNMAEKMAKVKHFLYPSYTDEGKQAALNEVIPIATLAVAEQAEAVRVGCNEGWRIGYEDGLNDERKDTINSQMPYDIDRYLVDNGYKQNI